MIKSIYKYFVGSGKPTNTPAPPVAAPPPPASNREITIKSGKEDRPYWRQSYSTVIERGIKIVITAKSYGRRSRYYSGELTQPNGRYVLFDPCAPADKILDREIIESVESVCTLAINSDRSYMRSSRVSFIDEDGVEWIRKDGLDHAY